MIHFLVKILKVLATSVNLQDRLSENFVYLLSTASSQKSVVYPLQNNYCFLCGLIVADFVKKIELVTLLPC